MEEPEHQHNLDEWGEYTGNRDEIEVKNHGVIKCITDNNPAITSVAVSLPRRESIYEERIEWDAAGKCLGNSKYLKHLSWYFPDDCTDYDILSFCKSLALNRSIAALDIRGDRSFICRNRGSEEDMFKMLLPFFSNNVNLQSINIGLQAAFPATLSDAIAGCESLKSITFGSTRVQDPYHVGDGNMDEVIKTICRKSGLIHFAVKDRSLSKLACSEIKGLLSDENCKLESLTFSRVNISQLGEIASGLVCNRSVKCLKLHLANCRLIELLLAPLQHSPLSALEKVTLGTDSNKVYEKGEKMGNFMSYKLAEVDGSSDLGLVAMVQQMPVLKGLSLVGFKFNASCWNTIFTSALGSSSNLHEFTLCCKEIGNNEIEELASCLSTNSKLKVLNLPWFNGLEYISTPILFNSMQRISLEELHLQGLRVTDSMLEAISQYLVSNQRIKVLKIPNMGTTSSQASLSLVAALESHTGIEEIDLGRLGDRNTSTLANALSVNSSLKRVKIHVNGLAQLQVIANIIAGQNCHWERLEIEYSPGGGYHSPMQLLRIDDAQRTQLTRIMVEALQRNTSMKVLNFNHLSWGFKYDWPLFNDLLCSTSSITATFQSNHTLQSLRIKGRSTRVPIELYCSLYLNQNSNKHAVACQKIIQSHTLSNEIFLPSSLPEVLSRIGTTNSDKILSQFYGILRKVPQVIEMNNKKRKIHD